MAEKEAQQEEQEPKRRLNKESMKEARKIFKYVRPYRKYFISGMVFLVISSFLTMAFPLVLGEMVNAASGEEVRFDLDRTQLALLLGGVLVVQAIFSFMRVWTFAQTSQRAMADIRAEVYDKLITLPIPYFEKNRVGEMTSRLTADVDQLEQVLSFTLAEFFRQMATLLISLPLIAYASWKLTIFMLALFPPMVIVAMIFGRFIRRESKSTRDKLADTNVIINETLNAIQVVKAFTNEVLEKARYRKSVDEVVKKALKTATWRGFFISFIIFAIFGTIVAVIWFGLGMVEDGTMKIGDLITFVTLTAFLGGSVGGIGDTYSTVLKALGASERIRELLDEDSELEATPIPDTADIQIKGAVSFENVHFSYPTRPDIEVLKDVSFTANAGQTIAFAGHSGAGKSTLTSLIQRFHQVSKGEIFIDGQPIEFYDVRKLRKHIGMVQQEVILFGGTIRENISYGRPGASDEDILEAARKANALEFIEAIPEGLDAVVGDRGIRLSGGQKQRIAIARAILKDPAILILDEATSSLDAESELLVQGALQKLMKNRTTLVIAHRLSTIRDADRIYVLDSGKIVESGTHEELSQVDEGVYQNLVAILAARD